jgi:hypothetical protein
LGSTSITTESSELGVKVESLFDLLQADEIITMNISNNLNLLKTIEDIFLVRLSNPKKV